MIPHMLKPSILRGYLQRNFEQMTASMGLIEAWRGYLQSSTGKNYTDIEELERYRLSQMGFTDGSLADRWRQFMASEGYTGDYRDALRSYFDSGTDGGGDDQTFDSSNAAGTPIGLLLALTHT